MSTYVLIHGAFHGAWCWEKVIPLLEKEGHRVVSPDLPGHGQDKTPMFEVTLDAYANKVCEVVTEQSEPVILVGHSMGGRVISHAAEKCSDKIKLLVYLTANLYLNGEWVAVGRPPGTDSLIPVMSDLSDDGLFRTIKTNGTEAADAFYNDCSDADIVNALAYLSPQAVQPLETGIHITDENYGQIPRVFIECLKDNAMKPALQKYMYTRLPCQQVISMNTGHSPFLSSPEELANNLISLSKSI